MLVETVYRVSRKLFNIVLCNTIFRKYRPVEFVENKTYNLTENLFTS